MQREQIVQKAAISFIRYGIKGVSMDHIAGTLRISKKTVYEHFGSKRRLLIECIILCINNYKDETHKEEMDANSALEAIIRINSLTFRQAFSICPAFYREIKYYKDAMVLINNEYFTFIRNEYLKYLAEGVKQGLFIANYNHQLTLNFFEERIKSAYQHALTNESRQMETYGQTILTYLAGSCTDKGRSLLNLIHSNQYYF